MQANGFATKECLYCGRDNNADAAQCAGCGAGSFGPIRYTMPPQQVSYYPMQQAGPIIQVQPAVRIVYFFLVGIIVSFYWIAFAFLLMLSVVGFPLGWALLRLLPTVATLQKQPESFGDTLGRGWQETMTGFRSSSIWAKLFALFAIVVLIWALRVLYRW